MTADELQRLRELASKATPGPWKTDEAPRLAGAINVDLDGYSRQVAHADGQAAMFDDKRGMETHEVQAANARFIAAASPSTVLALLDRIASLESQCARWEHQFTTTPGLAAANAEIVALRHEVERLKGVESDDLTNQLAQQGDVADLRHQLAAKEAEIEQLRSDLGDCNRCSASLQDELSGALIDFHRTEEERDEAQDKLTMLADEHRVALDELRTAKASLATVSAGPDFVWFWQSAGNHMQSLSCPVVMNAETLREIIAAKDEACDIADHLADYIANDNPYANKLARIERIAELRKVGAP